jgi:hypothetical protein
MKNIYIRQGDMYGFIGLSIALFFGLVFSLAYVNREEIKQNWAKYKYDPLYLFTAPLFKPADDPRSRTQFGIDNFKDAVYQNINNVFLRFLQPVFSIFKIFLDAMNQSLGGLFNIRMLIGKYWNAFNQMIDVFMRRFNMTFHQLRQTFTKLNAAFGNVAGILVSSVYTGISTVQTMTSFLDLMMKVIIAILVILVVMVILLFFVLWPFIPVILSVVAIISATAMGGAVGGMAGTFCFAHTTRVQTRDRGAVLISELRNGDTLHNGAVVQGTMVFNTNTDDLYSLYDVQVSGSHIVYIDDMPYFVSEHPDAKRIPPKKDTYLYCLITSNHRIPIISNIGIVEFADWEEISSDDELKEWHRHVLTILNPDTIRTTEVTDTISADILHSEAVVSARTKVWTTLGPVEIRGIRPGDSVLDANGTSTRVTGIVCVDASQVKAASKIGDNAWISAAAWISSDTKYWKHPEHTVPADGIHEWYSLFTESGSFRLCEIDALGLHIRDFTDVGPDRIQETYEWVLESLEAAVGKTDP